MEFAQFENELYNSGVSTESARRAADAAIIAVLRVLPDESCTVESVEYVLEQAKGKLKNMCVTISFQKYIEEVESKRQKRR